MLPSGDARLRAESCLLLFYTVNQQRTFCLEPAHLVRVTEPASGVAVGCRREVGNTTMFDLSEARDTKERRPFFGGEQMDGNFELSRPLMAVRIVAIKVDQDPDVAA